MMKTSENNIPPEQRIMVDTKTLQELLSCGRVGAVRIGTEAGARMQIGKRVLWNTKKIREYLDGVTC